MHTIEYGQNTGTAHDYWLVIYEGSGGQRSIVKSYSNMTDAINLARSLNGGIDHEQMKLIAFALEETSKILNMIRQSLDESGQGLR